MSELNTKLSSACRSALNEIVEISIRIASLSSYARRSLSRSARRTRSPTPRALASGGTRSGRTGSSSRSATPTAPSRRSCAGSNASVGIGDSCGWRAIAPHPRLAEIQPELVEIAKRLKAMESRLYAAIAKAEAMKR